MTEVVVINVALDENLSVFSQYLWAQGVSHRIVQDEQRQLLLVGNPEIALQVRNAYQLLRTGRQLPALNLPATPEPAVIISRLWERLPVTLGCIALSILGFVIVYLDRDFEWVRQLTFFDFEPVGQHLVFKVQAGQYWRLFTPIFLHFGLMHIAFNMAMLWFVGQRIELLQGSFRMLGVVLLIGLGSNVMQARFDEATIFGGMSGVVYGLLGYGWIWSWLRPTKNLQIPAVILYFSLAMMVLGFVGFASLLGAGKIANVAHLGGLIMGCLMGLVAALIDKYSHH